MRQYVAIMPDGSAIGILLDPTPLMPADRLERWWNGGTGIRRRADAPRAARALGAAVVVELVHRPARTSESGVLRRYTEETFCRVVHVA